MRPDIRTVENPMALPVMGAAEMVALAPIPIGLLILSLAIGAMFIWFVVRKTRSSMLREVTPHLSAFRFISDVFQSIAQFVVAPTGVMLLFVVLSQGSKWNWDGMPLFDREYDVLRPPAERANVATGEQASTGILISNSTANRPNWTQQSPSTSSDVTRLVLSSRLWTTSAEAESELGTKAAEALRADFDQRHHGWLDPKAVNCLKESRIIETAVKDRYLERVEQDFGTFSSPMNRLWWQVEISPIVRTELYTDWKRALVQNRILAVGTALALATMAFNALGMLAALSRLSITRRSQLLSAALAGGSVVTLWSFALLGLASMLMK